LGAPVVFVWGLSACNPPSFYFEHSVQLEAHQIVI